MAGTAERICAKFTYVFGPSLGWVSLSRSKVKGQGHQGQKTRCALTTLPCKLWTKWNALVADNVAQAADATTWSLQRGVFAGIRALGLVGYHWALPRISIVMTWKSLKQFYGYWLNVVFAKYRSSYNITWIKTLNSFYLYVFFYSVDNKFENKRLSQTDRATLCHLHPRYTDIL